MSNASEQKMGDYSDIPTEILNFDIQAFHNKRKKEKKQKALHRKLARKSSFLYTMNPNYSVRALNTRDKVARLYRRIDKFNIKLRDNMNNGNWTKPKGQPGVGWVKPKIEKFQTQIEYGTEKGFMHTHGLISLDGEAHVDLAKVREEAAKWFGGKVHLSFKYTQLNSREVLDQYINKMHRQNPEELGRPPEERHLEQRADPPWETVNISKPGQKIKLPSAIVRRVYQK